MKRAVECFLDSWIKEVTRKPHVLRGARQVGESWLVRDCARRHGKDLSYLKVKTTVENAVSYRLHSLPLYLAGMADKIVGGD